MFDIGGGELLLILIVVLVAFGPKKLPELAQSLGRGIREFKRAQRDFTDQINSAIEMENRRKTRTVSREAPMTIPAAGSAERPGDMDIPMPSLRPPVEEHVAAPAMETPSVPPVAHQVPPSGNPQ